jgi:hypothetical protein
MSQLLQFDIPLRLQCYRVPARWRCDKSASGDARYFCEVLENALSGVYEEKKPLRLEQLDPWALRLQFLDVDLDQSEAVLLFLNKVGLFAPTRKSISDIDRVIVVGAEDGRHVIPHDSSRAWQKDDFVDAQLFCRDWPCHLVDSSEATFEMRVAPVDGAPTLFITATNFYDAFQAAFAVDQIRRASRAKCKRPDCGKTFTYTGNRKRNYCGSECAHYMAVKAFRKRERRQRSKKRR